MRISSKQYGEALYQAVQDKNDSQIKAAVKNFFQIMVSNSDLSKANEIINEFVKIWNKKNGIIEADMESARILDNKIVKLLNNYIVKLSGAKKVSLNQKINKDILGGVVIKYEDKVLDGSLRMKLEALRCEMVK